jgi:uncharacterized protein YerC
MKKARSEFQGSYTEKQKRELTNRAINDMFYDLARLPGKEVVEKVLRDLLSPEEIRDVARRYLAAKLLSAGETYLSIQAKTDMSPPTIQKVNFKRKHGYGGFQLLFGAKR